MKKIFLPIIVLLLSFSGFAQLDTSSIKTIKIEDPSYYLPDYHFDNIYIGMPLADFESVKDTSSLFLSRSDADMWFGIDEEVDGESIYNIEYKFDREENGVNTERPLYQINIHYAEPDVEDAYLNEKFGKPQSINSDGVETWVFKTDKGYLLMVQKENKTVEIYATMKGTEYDPSR